MKVRNSLRAIQILLFVIYLLFVNTPRLMNPYIEITIMVLWVIIRIIQVGKITIDWKIIILVWLIYEVGLKIIGYSTSSWGNYGVHFLYFFPLCVYEFVHKDLKHEEKKFVLYSYFIILGFNLIDNIRILKQYPHINQLLDYVETYNGIQLSTINIGNTMYSFVLMLFGIICLFYYRRCHGLCFVMFLITLYYLILASKTTALLMLGVAAFVMAYYMMSKKIRATQRILILFGALILLILIYKFGIPFLAEIISDENIKVRLNAIAEFDIGSTYLSRVGLAKLSFSSFLRHPIIGVGYEIVDPKNVDLYSTGIGHHSEAIDLLGRYGIVGLAFNIFIYWNYLKWLRRIVSPIRKKTLPYTLLLIVFIYSFLNNIFSAEVGIVLFYIIPTLLSLNNEKRSDIYLNLYGNK